ncbi:MAG: alpha-galactosidase [Lentisphaeria bacterium]|jgi:hypothetical protein
MKVQSGSWQIEYDAHRSRLSLRHAASGASISGCLAMTVADKNWPVKDSRDGVADRLALLDDKNNVQGYIVFIGDDSRLEMRVLHRTAQAFTGRLHFMGEASLAESYPCRTRVPAELKMVQLCSGPADSPLNDSLYAPTTDRCLRLLTEGPLALARRGDGVCALDFTLSIELAAQAAIEFIAEEDYYRRRYVPYFAPIDRKRCPSPPTGWMSWNVYFDQAGAKENLDEARIGAEKLKPFGMEFWSIESWQADSDRLPVAGFDNLSLKSHVTQFPEGMKPLAEEIRKLGFRPGIWTAPFGTGSKAFYEAHKSWFLHNEAGEPISCWNGKYTLDPTQPEVIDYLREMHRIMSEEWGYEFFKIDGMSGRGRGYCAHMFEHEDVRKAFKDPSCPNPFERCVKAFREGIGPDRVFLACQGHYSGPEAAYADASRIGGDIVHPNKPSTWQNILSQASATINQLFTHGIVFFMDPDTLLVGDYRSLNEAQVTATIVSLPGQMMFAGDKLATLTPERMRILQQTLPVCDVMPLDLYPIFELLPVWDLKVKRPYGQWDIVALFNWSDEDAEICCNFAELGLSSEKSYAVYEFWTQSFCDIYTNECSMMVPAHGVRLLAVHEERNRPQFLSSNRHITQGAVDLLDLSWDEEEGELKGVVRLVGGYPTTLRFLIPEPYSVLEVKADEGVTTSRHVDNDGVLSVVFRTQKSCDASFQVLCNW